VPNRLRFTVRIDQGTIREILARTDIGSYIGTFVPLRKRGNDLVGLCPFHGEKTPSFHVHPDRGFFKCFGCGQAGDVIKFVQLQENLPFPEAARALARRAGIPLEEEDPAAARARGEKEQIYAANELAAAYFQAALRFGPEGEPARAYVASRGLDKATVEAFKLGYAAPAPPWDRLVRELTKHGVDLAIAEKAGLVKRGQSGYYDFYRARLMIPTYATTGEIVAFGGRALDDAQPKYLNTSTSPVYVKGRGLYALNVARRAAATRDALIVVEGYLDCIALHQAGFTNAVASLGTSFTPEQAAELRKYARRIFVCFDADAAGAGATVKSLDSLRDVGAEAFVVALPRGDDPDNFVRRSGAAAFTALIDGAAPAVQYKLDLEIEAVREQRLSPASAARESARFVRTLAAPEEWDKWIVYAANRLELSVNDVRNSTFAGNAANFAPRFGRGPQPTRHLAPAAEPPSIEREILAAFVDEPALVADYREEIGVDVFRDARYRAIYGVMRANAETLATASDVYAALGDNRDAVELLAMLQKTDRSSKVRFQDSAARRAHLDRVVEGLSESRLERRWKELDRKIDEAFASGDAVSTVERDEHRRLGEDLKARKKKRLGIR
jgi:DNA primase